MITSPMQLRLSDLITESSENGSTIRGKLLSDGLFALISEKNAI